MTGLDSPAALAARLIHLFPMFAAELDGEVIETYHQVIRHLSPLVAGYLDQSSERTIRAFCEIVNSMADAGGERENAISTCLLEHASQVGLMKVVRPHLNAAAKRELR